MITCNRDPSSFPEATAPHLNKTYNWQNIIFVALIKFGRKRTSDLLVYCGQSKCVGSTMHWKVWSESPRDKESTHSRSSDDNRQNNQKIIYLLRSPKGKGKGTMLQTWSSQPSSFLSLSKSLSPSVSLSLWLLPVKAAQRHPESTFIIFITLIITHHHSHYYLLRSPNGIQSAPEMIESTVIIFYHSFNQFSPSLSLSLTLLPVEITQGHP